VNLGEWTRKRAQLYPRRPFLKTGELALTNLDFQGRVDRSAAGLAGLGIQKGSRVAALMENGAAFLDLFFACAATGAIFVPINPRLAKSEIDHILADCAPLAVFHSPAHDDLATRLGPPGRPPWHRIRHGEGGDWARDAATPAAGGAQGVDPPSERDPLVLMYTSGTTGRPKGALLTHRNFLFGAIHSLLAYGLGPDCRSLVVAPLFHIGALGASVTPVVYAGGSLVLADFERPADTLRTLEAEEITYMFAVPVMYELMARSGRWEAADFSRVDFFIAGGAPMPAALIQRYQSEKGVGFAQGYGMTETLRVTNLDLADAGTKIGSIGKPAFHTEVMLVDDEGRAVSPGEPGEILVRGPTVFAGYWGQPGASAEVLNDGWFRTGDLARSDGEGFLYIVGRKSEVIICAGKNIYAAEVEQALRQLPMVVAAAVVGCPDKRRGEVPAAFVELEAPAAGNAAEALQTQLLPLLAEFKIPRRIQVVDRLPRGKSGKILKAELKRQIDN
jgi:fatty-acyl-CoA synthase